MRRPGSNRDDPWLLMRCTSLALVGILALGVWFPKEAAAQSKGKFLKDVAVAALGVLAAKRAKNAWDEHQQRQTEDALDTEADSFRDCFVSLLQRPAPQAQQTAVDKMLADLQYGRRLAKEDAEDIAYSALVDICEAHADRPYANLVAAYFQAGRNRANKFFTRYQRRFASCENIVALADSCQSANDWGIRPDANTYFARQLEVARRIWCTLDQTERNVIVGRAITGKRFAEIGQEQGLTSRQAHDRYHNTIRRIQVRLVAACPQ